MGDDIRKFAEQCDWAGCKQILLQKLIEADRVKSGNLCAEYIETYRPKFQDRGGDSDWLAMRLNQIRNSTLFSDDGNALPRFPDMEKKFNHPLLRNAKWAMFHFWSATRFYDNDEVRASKLVECLSNMLIIFRDEHPTWLREQHDTQVIKSPDMREYCKILWIELATKLDDL